MTAPSLPFKVLALAPFGTRDDAVGHRPPLRIDRLDVDRTLEELGIALDVPVPKSLCPAGEITVAVRRMKDFHPDGLVASQPFLRNLMEARTFVREAPARGISDDEVRARLRDWPDLPPGIGLIPRKPGPAAASPVDSILEMVVLPEGAPRPAGEAATVVAGIDAALRQAISAIVSDKAFRGLESVWRGVDLLLKQGEISGDVTLDIVPVTRDTLEETLARLTLDLADDLPSLVLVDLPFDSTPAGLDLLERTALFAETLLAPALCWVTPAFFRIDGWQELDRLPFLPHYLEEPAYAKWRRFRTTSPARWVAALCNRVLARYPYGPDNRPRAADVDERGYLWVSPVWAAAALIGQSLAGTGWPTRFTEWRRMRLTGLPLAPGGGRHAFPTEAGLGEDRIDQFIRGGFTPLAASADRDSAFLPAETAAGGGSFGHSLVLSRVARLLFWCKDNLAKTLDAAGIEEELRKAFSAFWQRTGHPPPEGLDIAVAPPPHGGPPNVRVAVVPSRDVLPSGDGIELTMPWSGD